MPPPITSVLKGASILTRVDSLTTVLSPGIEEIGHVNIPVPGRFTEVTRCIERVLAEARQLLDRDIVECGCRTQAAEAYPARVEFTAFTFDDAVCKSIAENRCADGERYRAGPGCRVN